MPSLSADAPQVGEIYRHYKGDLYKVVGLAIDSTDEWMVVYEAMYANPAAKLFTRPLAEWRQEVQWQGSWVPRFVKQ